MSVRLQARHVKVTILQCYAPTETDDEETRNSFYESLQDELDATPNHDLVILGGDLNAQICNDRTGYESTIGKFGSSHKHNDNGIRLLTFCAVNQLVIKNTFFQHKKIHKGTWKSPDRTYTNEIDHICISSRWKTSINNIRVMRGADVDTDHFLLLAKFRLKLKKITPKIQHQKPFDIDKLKCHAITEAYQLELSNRFQALEDENCDVNTSWNNFKKTITESAKETIGRRRGGPKEKWISDHTWDLIDERKISNAALNQKLADNTLTNSQKEDLKSAHSSLSKEVKRNCRKDKREWFKKKGTEAEEAASRNDTKTLYRIVRDLTNSKSKRGVPIKNKNGEILLKQSDQDNRWIEHFSEILNQPTPTELFSDEELLPNEDLPVRQDEISLSEVESAIKRLKSGKAPGDDKVAPEMLKNGGNSVSKALTNICNQCWNSVTVPDDWTKGIIVKLPKKGDLRDCNNWRGITLLSIPGKVFCSILLNRLRDAVDQNLRQEQAGFRKNRSCTEQIFALRMIIEQSLEYQQKLNFNFVDFVKAFDSIHRSSMWKILGTYGIPAKFKELFKAIYHNSACCIRTDEGYTPFLK